MSIVHCKECSKAIDTDFDNDMAGEICLSCLEGKTLAELYALRDALNDKTSKDLIDDLIANYE